MLTPEGGERADLHKLYLGSKSSPDAFAWFCADASTVDALQLS